MWIPYALVVHVLLLGSIFVIYFRSPVITGLTPQKRPLFYGLEPPANRLVLIVLDGFRADSFFEENCRYVPHLREIFLREGMVGVSRTRVPTETRPGHITLIAGLYEDPSAVLRGWKRNPIDFDTVFNRSSQTYAWGAEDVLHVFSKISKGENMHFRSYFDDLDFSPGYNAYELDEWVFKRVKLLLQDKSESLQQSKNVVFFLHLLGLDTSGHVHKPGSPKFRETVDKTEKGVYEIYQEFERVFPDKRTAYLLTADHGMTDSGAHGAGSLHETDTPFVLWGAGVARTAPNPGGRTFMPNNEGPAMPMYELEQAQLTPLMSALVGLAPPMNNFGTLPIGYMNVSKEYEAIANYLNALQLLEQYVALQEVHKKGMFAMVLSEFNVLSTEAIKSYKDSIVKLQKNREYTKALARSQVIMAQALDGIDYYHGYYRRALLLCTTSTFLGWIFYLYRLLTRNRAGKVELILERSTKTVRTSLGTSVVLLVLFLLGQGTPLDISFYLLLPFFVWLKALQPWNLCFSSSPASAYSAPALKTTMWQLILIIACAELMVFTFFERRLISLSFFVFACYNGWSNFEPKSRDFFTWLTLVVVLAFFPLLPLSVGYQNGYLLGAGVIVILLNSLWKTRTRLSYSNHTKFFNALILLQTILCAYLHSHGRNIPLPLNVTSWVFLVYAFASVVLSKESRLELRLAQIGFNLGSLYATLCTSYEAVFVQLLTLELSISLSAQNAQAEKSVLRLAFTLLLYTFFSLFGSGNIASISSFDPNIARCYLSHFAPFVIMGLVLLKLLVPVVLIMSVVYAQSEFVRQHEEQIFICLLLICDVMGLNFLFLVRNQGSWLDIGTSISHFVIMEVTTLVILVLFYAAKQLLLVLPWEEINIRSLPLRLIHWEVISAKNH
ncbi:GPI ethanolamine phosphate transferase 1 [Drosophila ficusphila]|uniref:GPI ethanolamine phosphate transferase 1 n=1 Tax=Drosophila ficusphila TaxID=30025 RepID=UPI0007E77639|nr:GPI ethanolamine phosphate transferase 1 [Drosophila ficusphila]